MISRENYITLSLETHLFFGRIMKEHAIFLEAGFTPKNKNLAKEADHYKMCFEKLLIDTVKMSNSRINQSVLNSGEIFTEYTLDAEKRTKYYTGIDINSKITVMEKNLDCKTLTNLDPKAVKCIKNLNDRALKLLDGLIDFKMKLSEDISCCKMFTTNYPLLIEHVIREAKIYRSYIKCVENDEDITKKDIRKIELVGNHIMMEHALFIRGLLDPSEDELIYTADKFANKFSELIQKASDANAMIVSGSSDNTLLAATKLRDFKKAATKGTLDCKIRSIILPLLSDHVLREANHYIRILNECD